VGFWTCTFFRGLWVPFGDFVVTHCKAVGVVRCFRTWDFSKYLLLYILCFIQNLEYVLLDIYCFLFYFLFLFVY
jgi:hypothetical protein